MTTPKRKSRARPSACKHPKAARFWIIFGHVLAWCESCGALAMEGPDSAPMWRLPSRTPSRARRKRA